MLLSASAMYFSECQFKCWKGRQIIVQAAFLEMARSISDLSSAVVVGSQRGTLAYGG